MVFVDMHVFVPAGARTHIREFGEPSWCQNVKERKRKPHSTQLCDIMVWIEKKIRLLSLSFVSCKSRH